MPDYRRRAVIAVVDDEERVRESLNILLESADYEVLLFSSAVALLESGCLPEIDCLISDVGMPAMDGCELARVAQARRPALPVILVTGRTDLLNPSAFDRPGHCRLITKPFAAQDLLAAVRAGLTRVHPHPPRS
jgi:FixJ family two-component response regulator